jgi:YebC/PmpR family DNA-binding regulatory protein
MSGHNKWSTIKHKKGAKDAARAKTWTRLIKEVTVAARMGGGDPDGNPRLRLAIQGARAANMPKDNIERAIKKGTGELEGTSLDEITYEGYGPEGVALLVEALTDNTNRTVGEVRATFNKKGGKMGEPGSVAWMFETKGHVTVPRGDGTFEEMFEAALEAGAEDVTDAGEQWLVTTAREDLYTVTIALEAAGLTVDEANLAQVPTTQVELTDAGVARKVMFLVECLEELDDVQNVWANFDVSDDVAAALDAED